MKRSFDPQRVEDHCNRKLLLMEMTRKTEEGAEAVCFKASGGHISRLWRRELTEGSLSSHPSYPPR